MSISKLIILKMIFLVKNFLILAVISFWKSYKKMKDILLVDIDKIIWRIVSNFTLNRKIQKLPTILC